jgi:hypothetical protein
MTNRSKPLILFGIEPLQILFCKNSPSPLIHDPSLLLNSFLVYQLLVINYCLLIIVYRLLFIDYCLLIIVYHLSFIVTYPLELQQKSYHPSKIFSEPLVHYSQVKVIVHLVLIASL